ncbi:hypothetical protein [Streptomyces sp. 150FB]|uniref:hypothetical protein n=1 Tax=Streptomyces sp. 150FB TaxID=1576605 RepID=UPI000AC685B4|nr:hypothetical protein [Streptomyces sp. 150FB]
MEETEQQVMTRVVAARAALADAATSQDPRAVRDALDELEGALMLARENDVNVPPAGPGVERTGS